MKLLIFLIICTLKVSAQNCNSEKPDPRVAKMLNTVLHDLPSSATTSVEQVRDVKIKTPPFPEADVQYIKITADSIPVQIYNPLHKTDLPIMISYHPGGFVTPILPFMQYEFWRQAKSFNCIVFAPDYRVAPEYKYPAAVNDAYNAFKWISENGQSFGGDTSKIILLGLSAGGNLTAVVTQKARHDGIEGKIKLQVMNCPSTDDPRNAERYGSYQRYASGYFLTKSFCQYYIRAYAPYENQNNPEIGPINTQDYSRLPAAVIITAEFDPLHDEGALYAQNLTKAGVTVWYKCFPGQIHCLLGLPPEADELKEADNIIAKAMQELVLYAKSFQH